MEIEFNSLEELYMRIKPALISKRTELRRLGLDYIKDEDIWNYFKEKKWRNTSNLSLAEMVNDVLNCDNYEIEKYTNEKLAKVPRTANFDE